ncbi:MAG TPA: aldo/keto reductase [Ardenticatenaceae bacterium]|nr:aldo/keto reductase [Ardenticatenaceae bacterium]
MNSYRIPNTTLEVSRIAYGCMQLGGPWDRSPYGPAETARAAKLLATAVEQGVTLFDHADIYAMGKSEAVFGEALRQSPGLRERIVIQSKCGIRFRDDPTPGDPGRYDFSYEHIVRSVEGSLRRLQTDYLDILLLHRPDPLVEPEEVARAFDELQREGKVRYFGVSNHTPGQMALLQKHLDQPLIANQVEISLLHAHLIHEGIIANQEGYAYTAAAGTLDYCRLHGILVQAWGPVAGGRLFNPPAGAEPRVYETASLIGRLAAEKGTSREAIALAWLLRHPAGIQPIVGTTRPERLAASCLADDVTLSREEWYGLFVAARGAGVP